MSLRILICAALLVPAAVGAAEPSKSGYAGQEARGIKALSAQDIEALRAGEGMGFAKAAELNGYPGPAHVLALANQLELTPEQLARTRAIESSMRAAARAIGAKLIEAERQLDSLFASGQITERSLGASIVRIGELQSALRRAHLSAHLEQAKLLDRRQTARYMHLRGYDSVQSHDPAAHERH
jgi:hypothetical protein